MQEQSDIVYVGIDLGTTYSSVCARNPQTGQYDVLQTEFMHNNFPSIVALTAGGVKVGDAAVSARANDTIHEVKRLMGKFIDSEKEEMEKLLNKLPNKVEPREDGRLGVVIEKIVKKEHRKQNILPEVISTMVLKKLK